MTHQVIAFSRPLRPAADGPVAPLSIAVRIKAPTTPPSAVALTVALRYLAERVRRTPIAVRPKLARGQD